MGLIFTCTSCGALLRVRPEHPPQFILCPACKRRIRVPRQRTDGEQAGGPTSDRAEEDGGRVTGDD